MASSPKLDEVADAVAEHGLVVLGSFAGSDLAPLELDSLVLVGAAGSAIWPGFVQSAEYLDRNPDPLDRWSRRIGDQVAAGLGARSLYPFDEDPPLPFLRWAAMAGSSAQSRLGMFIHDEFGLWHAYRFALGFSESVDQAPPNPRTGLSQTCIDCETVACLDACPVDAFAPDGFGADVCRDYLRADSTCDCMEGGCLARRACPEAVAFVYQPAHARFHMEAFVGA